MTPPEKAVDGFRFLPPGLAAWIDTFIPEEEFTGQIPWTPARPPKEAILALVTSAGISLRNDEPFDMEREKQDPSWGDRSFRCIPRGTLSREIEAHHLHINTGHIEQDMNVMLPIDRMAEFEREGVIGRLAETAYSFYGFQWQNEDFIEEAIAPTVPKMKDEGVDTVFLTPA